MESSALHTVVIISALLAALLFASIVGAWFLGTLMQQMSLPVVEPFVSDEQHEPFAVPMTAFPETVRSARGEAFCFGCDKPASETGVLSSVLMRGATVPADLCARCDALYGHHAVERAPLILVRGDLSDFEIPVRILQFPESASVVKRAGLVS